MFPECKLEQIRQVLQVRPGDALRVASLAHDAGPLLAARAAEWRACGASSAALSARATPRRHASQKRKPAHLVAPAAGRRASRSASRAATARAPAAATSARATACARRQHVSTARLCTDTSKTILPSPLIDTIVG